MEEICRAVNSLGGDVCAKSLPNLELEEFADEESIATALRKKQKESFDPGI